MKRLFLCFFVLSVFLCACAAQTLTDAGGFLRQLRHIEKSYAPPQEEWLVEQVQEGYIYSIFLNIVPPGQGEQLCLLRLYEQEDGHLKRCTVTYALQRDQAQQEQTMDAAKRTQFMQLCASVTAAYTSSSLQEAQALLQARFSAQGAGESAFEENFFRYKWLEAQPGISFTLENVRLNPTNGEALTLRESETQAKRTTAASE